jgi:hypothetical protein
VKKPNAHVIPSRSEESKTYALRDMVRIRFLAEFILSGAEGLGMTWGWSLLVLAKR